MKKPNAIGWFDIYVEDLDRATKFYEKTFDQKFEDMNDPSGETKMKAFPTEMTSYGSSGALVKSKYSKPGVGGTMIYFSVEDCSTIEPKAKKAGGKIIQPKFSIGQFGFVSILEDSEGNLIGLSSMK
jgi:uncharacterized protein